MRGQDVLFSKGKDDWRTPDEVWGPLDEEFRFDTDVAADPTNTLCLRWLGPGSPNPNALTANWRALGIKVAWCNPPYSLKGLFAAKAMQEAINGVTTVMLLPARTDTKWFHEFVWNREKHRPWLRTELRFYKGRIKFLDADGHPRLDRHGRPMGAPFPSMVVIFRATVPQEMS